MYLKPTVNELREALLILDTKTHYADYCENRYSESPQDLVAEMEFDRAYKEEHEAFNKAKDVLSRMIGCDGATANRLLRKNRTDIDKVIERWVKDRRGNYADLRAIIQQPDISPLTDTKPV